MHIWSFLLLSLWKVFENHSSKFKVRGYNSQAWDNVSEDGLTTQAWISRLWRRNITAATRPRVDGPILQTPYDSKSWGSSTRKLHLPCLSVKMFSRVSRRKLNKLYSAAACKKWLLAETRVEERSLYCLHKHWWIGSWWQPCSIYDLLERTPWGPRPCTW
jgi:hypothetical protein